MYVSEESPCKDCTDRTTEPNCHTHCMAYRIWRAAKQEEKELLETLASALNSIKSGEHDKRQIRRPKRTRLKNFMEFWYLLKGSAHESLLRPWGLLYLIRELHMDMGEGSRWRSTNDG